MTDDLSDILGTATDPLETLMGLLSPDNQAWLKSQTPERQKQIAEGFDTNSGFFGTTGNAGKSVESSLDPGSLSKSANRYVGNLKGRQ
ncbi:hypothetical protein ACFQ0X_43325 [Streptomyces rectiviolaceus]|uniref:Uncharacterized protein n=1 Tax=Streptomyces rectiviolaceus TaxID=332591 RepID=A0ABP6MGG0_9ACTN